MKDTDYSLIPIQLPIEGSFSFETGERYLCPNRRTKKPRYERSKDCRYWLSER
jgi:hypothetical protein